MGMAEMMSNISMLDDNRRNVSLRNVKPECPKPGAFAIVVIRSTSWEYWTVGPSSTATLAASEAFKLATLDPNTLFAILYDHNGCADVYEVA
jgi:hypothetical protein